MTYKEFAKDKMFCTSCESYEKGKCKKIPELKLNDEKNRPYYCPIQEVE